MKSFTLAIAFASSLGSTVSSPQTPPNIVFLIVESTDGRLFKPSSSLPIPNIRGLLATQGGVIFNATYSNSPMCAPSRTSMISGRNVHEIPHAHAFGPGGTGVVQVGGAYNNQEGLALDDNATLDVMLASAGYATNVLGKTDWRVGGHIIDCALVPATMNVAWPYSVNLTGGWADEPGNAFGCLYPGTVKPGGSSGANGSTHEGDWTVVAQGVEWIRARAAEREAGGAPFFAYQGFNIVHPPYVTNSYWFDKMPATDAPDWVAPITDLHPCDFQASMKKGCFPSDANPFRETFYSAAQKEYVRKIYLATIAEFDAMVGEYVAAVAAAGQLANTVFVITSDHGDMQMSHQQFYKMSPLDGSARVPLIIAGGGAGGSPAQTVIVEQPTQLLDLFPTLLGFANAPVPSYAAGYALQPLLSGASLDPARPPFVISQFHGESSSQSWFLIVEENYKLIVYGSGREVPDQLFNLTADAGEGTNIAYTPAGAAVRAMLRAHLDGEMNITAVALQVAQYGKDVILAWGAATEGGWEKGVRSPNLSWATAFAAAPAESEKAIRDWLDAPLFLQGCVGNLTTGSFAAEPSGQSAQSAEGT
jgi:arylsulfatase A-like enzyme